jgi:predicted nucleic acid-binding protein
MPFNALLDACVLYPVYVRDTLLSIAESGLYRVLWSEEILDETRRNILDDNPHLRDTAQLDKTFAAMRRAFPDAIVTGHEAIIDQMTNHPKDRHVLAAAVVGGAQVLVTNNIRDFADISVAPYHLDVQTPTPAD